MLDFSGALGCTAHMRCLRSDPSVVAMAQRALEKETDPVVRDKLMVIERAFASDKHRMTASAIAAHVKRSRATVFAWLALYAKVGIKGLIQPSGRGRPPKVIGVCRNDLVKGLKQRRWRKINEVRAWLERVYGVRLSKAGTDYWIRELGGVFGLEGERSTLDFFPIFKAGRARTLRGKAPLGKSNVYWTRTNAERRALAASLKRDLKRRFKRSSQP